MQRLVLFFVIASLLVACGGPSEAEMQAMVEQALNATATQLAEDICGPIALAEYATRMEKQISKFEMQKSVTGSTPRASIGVSLQALLDIQTETQEIETPECLQPFQEQVVSMMGLYRFAYQTFASQGDDIAVQLGLMMGDESLREAQRQLEVVRAGSVPLPATPEPTPDFSSPQAIDYQYNLDLYTGPGKEYAKLATVPGPMKVLLKSRLSINGTPWYKVRVSYLESIDTWVTIVGVDSEVLKDVPVYTGE